MSQELDREAFSNFVRALAFASRKHSKQRRKDADASPYINHPIALVSILAVEAGINDWDTLCAGLLHDTIEDTRMAKTPKRRDVKEIKAALEQLVKAHGAYYDSWRRARFEKSTIEEDLEEDHRPRTKEKACG